MLTAFQLVPLLAAVVTPRGHTLVRCHGLLSANAKERAAIVPGSPAVSSGCKDAGLTGPASLMPLPRNNNRDLEWPALLLRVIEIQRLRDGHGRKLRPQPASATENTERTGLVVLSSAIDKALHADYLPLSLLYRALLAPSTLGHDGAAARGTGETGGAHGAISERLRARARRHVRP